MAIKIVTDDSLFSSMKEIWDALFEKSRHARIFQSFEWNYTWWINEHSGEKLFLILYFDQAGGDNKVPSAIFPFYIDKSATLRFIADRHSDYSSFLIEDKKRTSIYKIFKEVKKAVSQRAECKNIELKNISQSDPYIALFSTLFDHRQIMYHSNGSSFLQLEPESDFSKRFLYLDSKRRSELKRIGKQFATTKSTVISYPQPFPESTLKSLSEAMIESGMRDRNFLNDRLMSVIKALYDAKNLYIHQISDTDDRPVAINLILPQQDDTFLFWIDLFIDLKNINIYSYLAFIDHLCKGRDKAFIVDFGRGLYDYKIRNFYPVIELQYTFYHSRKSTVFAIYIAKLFLKFLIKNFYKKHKETINRLLRR